MYITICTSLKGCDPVPSYWSVPSKSNNSSNLENVKRKQSPGLHAQIHYLHRKDEDALEALAHNAEQRHALKVHLQKHIQEQQAELDIANEKIDISAGLSDGREDFWGVRQVTLM